MKSSEHQYSHNGQQIVTLDTRGDPSSLLWQVSIPSMLLLLFLPSSYIVRPSASTKVREAHNTTSCVTGEPIRCGATVRLVHVGTRRLLHSHGVPAPLSPRNGEVSGFGEDGVGDAGDNWKVQCLHPKEDGNADRLLLDRRRRLWESTTLLRLLHVDTNRWLSSSTKVKFSQSNCPGCPILGELEVSGTSRSSDASTFRADDGAYLQIVDV